MKSPSSSESVLIIDDDPAVRLGLTHILSKRYSVHLAKTMGEGLSAIKKDKPDAVILDLCLPDQHGIEGLERIRKIDESLPVIILTGYPSFETVVQALRRGAADYLEKPISAQSLENRIRCALDQTGGRLRPPMPSPPAIETTGKLPLAHDEDLLEMLHDFSNPLTSLSLMAQNFPYMAANLTAGNSNALEEINQTSQDFSHQVNYLITLVEFWRDTELRRQRRCNPYPIGGLVHEIQNQTHMKLANRNIEFTCLYSKCDSLKIDIDQVLLTRVLNNLIDNAVAASKPSAAKILLQVRSCGNRCIITIQDNGHGIHVEHQQKIFMKAWTTKQSGESHGLGLTLVEKTLHRIGGRVFFSSIEGQGSTFAINIPKATPAHPDGN